ncbi:MAG: Mur ligase family protein [Candidatus Neomarinimicrobiota bacterium]
MLSGELLDYLFGLERRGIKLGLGPTRELLALCGHPNRAQPLIQVAGTNGKGSTAAISAKILEYHGLRVGLFTSPHLLRFNERIRINGACVEDDYIVNWVQHHKGDIEQIETTFFETTTALALCYFRDRKVDVAVLETGLGGRLDATTAAEAAWTALTPIDLDHTEILGETQEAIAREKAGILRAGVPCYSAPQHDTVRAVLSTVAGEVKAPLTFVPEGLEVPQPVHLPGDHQLVNTRLAWILASGFLSKSFDRQQAAQAVEAVVWPGRYQLLQETPRVIFDVAHNPHGIRACLANIAKEDSPGCKWLVLALQVGKDAEQVLRMLLEWFDEVILTQTDTRLFLAAGDLAALAGTFRSEFHIIPTAGKAIDQALLKARDDDLVAIIGSHYLGPAVAEKFKISFDKLG